MKFLFPIYFLFTSLLASAVSPQVSNISYSQRIDQNGSRTKLVDIQYDLDGNRSMYVEFFFSHDGGLSFPIICTAVSGDGGSGIQAGTSKNATWDASVDWDKNFTEQGRIMIKATYSDQPTGFPGLDGNGSFQEPFHVVELNSSINLEMIWVEPGTFTMGSDFNSSNYNESNPNKYRYGRIPEHNVTLTKGFYLGKHEVTQAQYEAVMNGNSDGFSPTPSFFAQNPHRPVEQVGMASIQIFLARLNSVEALNLPSKWKYVLPTEAQWEYACRAGTRTLYSWGDYINSSHANFSNYSEPPPRDTETTNVGEYPANPWGFFDMHGNVLEFTADWYERPYVPTGNPMVDPIGTKVDSYENLRGGSWGYEGETLVYFNDLWPGPGTQGNNQGFRLALQEQ